MSETLVVGLGALASATLYCIAYLQLRREIPDKAGIYLAEALTTACGATVVAAMRGFGPVMWVTAPALVASLGFLAGKGSIPVLLHDGMEGDEVPAETASARTRFAVLVVVACVVLFVVVFATG